MLHPDLARPRLLIKWSAWRPQLDENNNSNIQHPLHAALTIFNAAVQTVFATAAAFWRPWAAEPEKREEFGGEQPQAPKEEISRPIMRTQTPEEELFRPMTRTQAPKEEIFRPMTRTQAPKEQLSRPMTRMQVPNEGLSRPKRRTQTPTPVPQKEALEKKPKAPIKRSLKEEQELELEERAQKTERLRKLRLAKEAADRQKNSIQ